MPTQLVKLALIDSSPLLTQESPTIETFSIFQEGAQDASRQVISIEPSVLNIEGGRELVESKTYAIDVAGLYDVSKRSQIQTWSKNRQKLYLVGYGLDDSLLYAWGAITSVSGTGTNMSFKFRMQNDAAGGYLSDTSQHSASMSYCANLFSLWKWEENPNSSTDLPFFLDSRLYDADSDLDKYIAPASPAGADPLSDEGAISRAWENGGWQITNGADGNAFTSIYRWFPFSGKKLNFSVTCNLRTAGDNGYKLFFQTLKETAGANTLQQVTSSSFTTVGESTNTISIDSTDAETLYVRAIVRTTPNSIVVIKNPIISLGDVATFTEFNT